MTLRRGSDVVGEVTAAFNPEGASNPECLHARTWGHMLPHASQRGNWAPTVTGPVTSMTGMRPSLGPDQGGGGETDLRPGGGGGGETISLIHLLVLVECERG